MSDGPSSQRRTKLPPPKRGKTPQRIGKDMNDPGGPHTPGAKKKRKKKDGS